MENLEIIERLNEIYDKSNIWVILRPIIFTFLSNDLITAKTYKYKLFNKNTKMVLREIFALCLMLKFPHNKYESLENFLFQYPEFVDYINRDKINLFAYANNVNTYIKLHKDPTKLYCILFSGLLEPMSNRYTIGLSKKLCYKIREWIYYRESSKSLIFPVPENICMQISVHIPNCTRVPYIFEKIENDDISTLRIAINEMIYHNNKKRTDLISLAEINNSFNPNSFLEGIIPSTKETIDDKTEDPNRILILEEYERVIAYFKQKYS